MMIHPWLCYLGIFLAFSVSLGCFSSGLLNAQDYFYAPLLLLIAFHTIHGMVTDRQVYERRQLRQVLPKAVGKYVMWVLVLWGVNSFYGAHPLYNGTHLVYQQVDAQYRDITLHTRHFLSHYLKLVLVGGLPYFFLAEKFRYCRDNVLNDPYLKVLSLLRALIRGRFRKIGRRLYKHPYRPMCLMALLRMHYIPIMVEQVYYGMTNLTKCLDAQTGQSWTLSSGLLVVTILAWAIDSNNGAMGYFWESWFTRTRFRDMDPYPLHWFVVLICYVPFIHYASQFVPFPSLADGSPTLLHGTGGWILEVALVVLLVLYVLSGSALTFATSNLCYKKIQTRGPYAVVRHPATTFKLAFFFLAFFRYRAAWTVVGLLCYLVWMGVYIGRALAEEQYLRLYPDYRAYMKKTRYRFIPGVC
jgi:protein-S-isoprenylcysteine O-methyltransferase Ste14